MNFDTINLLDKLNLHFKVPNAVVGLVEFNEIEQTFVDRIEKIKKFSELDKICVEICDYIKENRTEEEAEDSQYFDEESEDYSDFDVEEFESDDFESGDDADTDEEPEQGSASEGDEESDEDEDDEKSDSAKANKEESENEDDKKEDSDKDGKESNNVTGNQRPDHYDELDNVPDDLKSKTLENFENALIGVNNRNLNTFEVDINNSV